MPPAGFEPTFSADERPQTYALDRAATGTGNTTLYLLKYAVWSRGGYNYGLIFENGTLNTPDKV